MISKVKKAVFLLLFFFYGLPLASQNIAGSVEIYCG